MMDMMAMPEQPLPFWLTGAEPEEMLPHWLTGGEPEPPEPEVPTLDITMVAELEGFLEPHRYKVAHGGRGSTKSWGIARLLIARAYSRREKILCCRELQTSIEESVIALLADQIHRMRLTSAFEIQAKKITCLTTGSVFLFEGLKANVKKIKSMEGVTLVWAEEAEKISKNSWDVLIPTIRQEDSEIWISFNPDDDLDDTWVRFVEDPPPDTYVTQINYHKNPWFPEVLRKEMEYLKAKDYEEYEHTWLGKPRKAVKGAYYATQMLKALEEGRIGPIPYDETLPVQVSFDLGMADSTVLWFAQRSGTAVFIIDCWEFKGTNLQIIAKKLIDSPYIISQIILPHDGKVRGMITGMKRKEVFENLGFNVSTAPGIHEGIGLDDGIRATKTFLSRCYFDKTKCADGIKALKRYRTKYNEERKVFDNKPFHDWCVTGDTMITMDTGLKRIDAVQVGDRVMLGDASYPVTVTHDNGHKPTVDVTLSNGTKISCTEDHKIFTTRGLVPVSELCYTDEILTDKEDISQWLQSSKGIKEAFTESMMGSSFGSGPREGCIVLKQTTSRRSFIGLCGQRLMETYHTCMQSFLSLETGRTLALTTGYADQEARMVDPLNQSIPMSSLEGSSTTKTQGQDTTTTHTARGIKPCSIETPMKILTGLAQLKDWTSITLTLIKRTMSRITSKPCRVVSICRSTGPMKRVHDLTVAHQHAYYANGILISNCSDFADSLRYLAVTEPEVDFNNWSLPIDYEEASELI